MRTIFFKKKGSFASLPAEGTEFLNVFIFLKYADICFFISYEFLNSQQNWGIAET